MSKVPLAVRKSIKLAEVNNEEHIERINSALGTKWTLELDYAALYEQFKDLRPDYAEQVGEVTNWYLDPFADKIISFSQKDELNKEALVEEVKGIKGFKVVPPGSFEGYNKLELEDGKLVIVIKEDTFAVNVDQLGEDLESLF